MLSGNNLWFRHGRRHPWVISNLDISLAPGRVIGLSGPSGAGKSTLAALLAGILRPKSGEVVLAGRSLHTYRGVRPVQLVTQRPETAMNPRWRIGRILAEAGPEGADHDLVDAQWWDRFPHEISGGELQRVNLARALRAGPSFVVADEISSSLDAITQAMLWERLLTQVAAEDLGVLAISHDPNLLNAVADDVFDVRDLSASSTPAPA